MRRFLSVVIIFCVPLIIGAWLLDYGITNSLKESKQGSLGVWNDLLTGRVDAEVVIYGSSRAWVHINPKIIEQEAGAKAYNLGEDAFDLSLQKSRHDLLLEENIRPRIVILCLDYFIFSKRELLPNPEQFLSNLDNSTIREVTQQYEAFNTWDYTLPLWPYKGYSGAIRQALTIAIKPEVNKYDRFHGFKGQEREWNNDLLKATTAKKSYNQPVDSVEIERLDRFVEHIIDSGISLILVYPPEYIEGQSFVNNRAVVIDKFIQCAKKFNIPFYDYSNDSISYNRQYFYNSQHLNAQGADLFTRKLIDDLHRAELLKKPN